MGMGIGKASNSVIKRSVLKLIKKTDKNVIAPAAIGNDCAVINIEADDIFMASETGLYPVIKCVNNIYAAGGMPIGAQDCIVFPENEEESKLKECMVKLNDECMKCQIQLTGGHTQVSTYVRKPVVTVTVAGRRAAKRCRLKSGMDIVVTKHIGIGGIRALIELKRDEILKRYTPLVISKAEGCEEDMLVCQDARVINSFLEEKEMAVTDASMGGILAALWNFAEAGHCGLSIDLKKIPVKQEIIEICEMFDVNPYELDSTGALVIGTYEGKKLVKYLMEANIPAVIIGKSTDGNQKLIFNDGEERFMDTPKIDQIERFLDGGNYA